MDPQLFERAAKLARLMFSAPPTSSATLFTQNDKLKLYALYKQATVGKCTGPRPSFFDVEGKAKYSAWSDLGDLPRATAMCQYVELVLEKAMSLQASIYDGLSLNSSDDPNLEELLDRILGFKQDCAKLWPERFAHLRSPEASEMTADAYQDEYIIFGDLTHAKLMCLFREATSYADIEANPSYSTPLISETIGAPIAENIASLLSPMSHTLVSDLPASDQSASELEDDPLHVKEPHHLEASAESLLRRPGLGCDTHECLWQILDRIEKLELSVAELQFRITEAEARGKVRSYLGLSFCAALGFCTSLFYYNYLKFKSQNSHH